MSFVPQFQSVLPARWQDPQALARVEARWREVGAVRIDDVLPPGLAAELAVGLNRLPLVLTAVQGEVAWSVGVVMPPASEPQMFQPLVRLFRLIAVELPALCLAITGRRLVASPPDQITVVAYRKGSWTETRVDAAAGGVACTIGIAAGTWPAAWGGHDERFDAHGNVIWREPLMPGTVELADVSLVRRVAVLTHHVERVEVRALLCAPED